jgi:uncharacterized repeat protein (TIGR03803 family)
LRLLKRSLRTICATLVVLSFLNLTPRSQALAASESVLWSFGSGTDGVNPAGGLVADKNGNLYGTTYEGGTFATRPFFDIAGTVFELKPPSTTGGDWSESILWNFGHGTDGSKISSGPIIDTGGNLYGTTAEGGAYNGGTVYEMKPPSSAGGDWTESILWSFGHGSDGGYLVGDRLIMDTGGNLYGTTKLGGAYNGGTAYELKPPSTAGGDWTESILWSFGNGADSDEPAAGLIEDKRGNLYGTSFYGGAYASASVNGGTVFELIPPTTQGGDWTESILWSFGNGSDGQGPSASLIMDTAGNLYGTTNGGGPFASRQTNGGGTVFELTPPSTGGDWTESILWNFGEGSDGVNPVAGLIMDSNRNLYGTTSGGPGPVNGIVFELTPPSTTGGDWTESILWSFFTGTDGDFPTAGLIMDASGNLYGTTSAGGAYPAQGLGFEPGGGTVFEIDPTGTQAPTPTPTPTVLTASPGKLSFGDVDATGTSKPKKVRLTNKGKVVAQISSVSATAPFAIAGGNNTCTGQTLAPKKTCSFEVEFAPTTVANETGGIEVTYNGPSPAIALAGDGIPVTLKAPKSTSLPALGTPKNIVFSNPSTITITFGAAVLGGSDPGSFKIADDACSGKSLAPKGTCSIGVEFAPPGNGNGTQSATLSVGFTYGFNGGNVMADLSGKVK